MISFIKKASYLFTLSICILLFTSCKSKSGANNGAKDESNTLYIVHTNDVHSYVDVEPYVKSLVESYRAEGKEVFLISAGDAFSGTPFASLTEGKDVAEVMNRTGYELFVLGNHEQLGGPKLMKTVTEMLTCPVLGTNISEELLEAGKGVKDYVIKDYFGAKVAFLGLSTIIEPDPAVVSGDALVEKMEKIKAEAEKEGATIFIGVTHVGVTDPDETNRSTYIADHCSWLTAIIDAHCHTAHENGLYVNDVLIAEAGEYGSHIGVVELEFKDGAVVSKKARVIPIAGFEETCGIIPDPELKQFIDQKKAENDIFLKAVIANIPFDLDGERETTRSTQTYLGSLLADAALWKTKADIAIVHSPFIRNSIAAGDFTNEMLMTVFLNPRELFTKEVKGQEIIDMLENGLQAYPKVSGAYLQIGGMHVVFDPDAAPLSRVVSITLKNGEKLDPEKTYTMTSGQAKLILGEEAQEGIDYKEGFGTMNQAFVDYLNEQTIEKPDSDQRMTIKTK